MSFGDQNDANIVVTADIGGYTSAMQTGVQETSKLTAALTTFQQKYDDVRRTTSQRLTLVDAAATAGVVAATASAARLEDRLSQLEGRSVLVNRRFSESTRAVSDLRREFGMTADAAVHLLSTMNNMGARTQQSQRLAQSYVRLSAVTGESVTGLAGQQNQFMRSMNGGVLNSNEVNRYSAMTASMSQNYGVSPTNTLAMANSIAPIAKNLGMNQRDVMGLSTALTAAGQDGVGASTALTQIMSAINQSKQWGGGSARQYASYLGVDADQFKSMPMRDVVTRLVDKLGEDGPQGVKFLERQGLDGVRVQRSMAALANSGGISNAINDAYSSFSSSGEKKFEEASSKALSGLNEEGRKLAETMKSAGEAMGSIMLPAVTKVAEGLNTLLTPLNSVSDWVKNSMPDSAKGVLGGIVTAGFVGKSMSVLGGGPIAGGLLAAGGMQTLRNGSAALGYREGRGRLTGVSTPDLEMFRSGSAAGGQQAFFNIAQGIGEMILNSEQGRKGFTDSFKKVASRGANKGAFWIEDLLSDALRPGYNPRSANKNNRQSSLIRSRSFGEFFDTAAYTLGGMADGNPNFIGRARFGGDDDRLSRTEETINQRRNQEYVRSGNRNVNGNPFWQGAKAYGRTTARGVGAMAGAGTELVGAASGALMRSPVGLAMAGVIGAGALMGAVSEADKKYDEKIAGQAINTPDGFVSATDKYIEALGLATTAVKTFADEVNGQTSTSAFAAANASQALTVTKAEIDSAAGRRDKMIAPEIAELYTGDDKKNEAALRAYMRATMPSVVNSTDLNMRQADFLATGFKGDMVEKVMTEVYNEYKDAGKDFMPVNFYDMAKASPDDPNIMANVSSNFRDVLTTTQKNNGSDAASMIFSKGIAEGVFGGNLNNLYDVNDMNLEARNTALRGVFESNGIDLSDEDNRKNFESMLFKLDEIVKTGSFDPATGAPTSKAAGVQSGVENRQLIEDTLNEFSKKSGGALNIDFDNMSGYDSKYLSPTILSRSDRIRQSLKNAGLTGFASDVFQDPSAQGKTIWDESMYNEANNWALSAGSRAFASAMVNRSGGDYSTAMDFVSGAAVKTANSNDGSSQIFKAALDIIKSDRDVNAMTSGQSGIRFASQRSIDDYTSARNIFNANPMDDAASANYDEAAAGQIAAFQNADGFVRNMWQQFRGLDLSKKFSDANLGRSQSMATRDFNIQMGRQTADRDRSLAWEKEDFARSMRINQESFERSRKYGEEDFQLGRERAQEDYSRSRKFQEDDYQLYRQRSEEQFQKQLMRQERDWTKNRTRQLEDFNRSRTREEQDFNHQTERMAKATATNIYDIYSRVAVERTWSVQNLLQNMADQQKYLDGQLANLEKLRDFGVSNDAVEMLGLTDSSKAQQLQRIVDELSRNPSQAAAINQSAQDRITSTGELMTDESNSSWQETMYQREKNLAQQLEDFERSRNQAEADYKQSLNDTVADFALSLKHQAEDLERSMDRSDDAFQQSLERQLDDYTKGLERSLTEFQLNTKLTNEEHSRSLIRSEELFNESVARSKADFNRALKDQRDSAQISYEQSKEMLNQQFEDISKSTEEIFEELGVQVNGATKKQLDELQGYYDKMKKNVQDIHGLVSVTYQTLGVPNSAGMTTIAGTVVGKFGTQIGGAGGTNPVAAPSNDGWLGGANTGGATGGGDIDTTLKGFADRKQFTKYDDDVSESWLRTKVKKGETGKWWEKKLREDYEKYFGASAGVYGVVPNGAGYVWPTITKRMSGNYAGHSGVDIPVPIGSPLYAVDGGRITYVGWGKGYGNAIFMQDSKGLNWVYGHGSQPGVGKGQTVSKGQRIGLSGNTGRSTGPHLHIEATRDSFNKASNRNYTLSVLSGAPMVGAPTASSSTSRVGSGKTQLDRASYDMLKRAEALRGAAYTLTQGAFQPYTALSGWSHTGAGVIDVGQSTDRDVLFLRRVGAAAWGRGPAYGSSKFRPHTHAVFPVSGLHSSALAQYKAYLAGGDGLSGTTTRDQNTRVVIDPAVAAGAKAGYAGGTPNAAPGIRPVGEHGIEVVFGRGMKMFMGGESVLNPIQTRQAFGKGMNGTVATGNNSAPGNIHYDSSMRIEQVVVQSDNVGHLRQQLEAKQRMTALTGRKG